MAGIKSLFRSRKFVLTVTSVALQLVLGMTSGDAQIWRTLAPTIAASVAALVLSIAWEDTQLVETNEVEQ